MSIQHLVVWDSDPVPFTQESVRLIGGKALGLHQIKHLGIRVPQWATLTTILFHHLCGRDNELRELLATSSTDDFKRASLLRNRIKNMPVEGEEKDLLIAVWRKISQYGDHPIAVRSSAADEDSALLSFAGQMDSFLNVTNEEGYLKAIRSCWASLFGDRAVLYRRSNNIDPWSPQIAVIVQRMVEASASGIVFTANPLTGSLREMLVNSTWGLGEGLVAGITEADIFILDARGNMLKRDLSEKKQITVYAEKGGTESRAFAGKEVCSPSMTEQQLKEVHTVGLKVQEFKGMPVDIEFAIAEGTVFFLQARPITTLKGQLELARDNFKIWDNSNIVESYSGITTPLTFSFIKKAYSAVYWQFCEVIGVDRKTIFRSRHMFENMLGLIHGRVYYNLLNWYKLVSLMPGFSYNKRFMEQMMGLQVTKEFDLGEERRSRWEKYFVQLPKLMKVGTKMLVSHFSLRRRIEKFHKHFDSVNARYSKMDYENMTPTQILNVYNALEDEVLWEWKAPILNDFEAMIFYGLLKRLTVKWELDRDGTLQNDLLCGSGGIRSTRVTDELAYIAKMIKDREDLKTVFLQYSPEEMLMKIRSSPEFSDVKRALDYYLDTYGVRSIDEMKLESIPVRDNPSFCVSMIQNYLRTTVPDPDRRRRHEQDIRTRAERILKEQLKERNALLFPFATCLYGWILKNTRNAIRNRENQRFARAEAYSLVRDLVRAIGGKWHARGILDNPADIFYLEIDEVWSFIDGTASTAQLQGLTDLRKKEFGTYQMKNPADHIETYGEVYTSEAISPEEGFHGEEELYLKGLGCCRGIVEGNVQVVIKPESAIRLAGDIMVAKQTDPGWVVLFPSLSGLIIEKGSMLSHSAIVAREMGIPTVVGVKNATRLLRTGDRVKLDGASGEIRIMQRADGGSVQDGNREMHGH
jgi:phosphohistidine swiveling domain-containing protein